MGPFAGPAALPDAARCVAHSRRHTRARRILLSQGPANERVPSPTHEIPIGDLGQRLAPRRSGRVQRRDSSTDPSGHERPAMTSRLAARITHYYTEFLAIAGGVQRFGGLAERVREFHPVQEAQNPIVGGVQVAQ